MAVEHGYAGLGFQAGGDIGGTNAFHTGLTFEAGVALPSLPLWARGAYARGSESDNGTFSELRGGIEARSGTRADRVAVFGSVDFGYHTEHVFADPGLVHHYGVLAGGRFGGDFGGDLIRFRIALEIAGWRDSSAFGPVSWTKLAVLAAAVVVRF